MSDMYIIFIINIMQFDWYKTFIRVLEGKLSKHKTQKVLMQKLYSQTWLKWFVL